MKKVLSIIMAIAIILTIFVFPSTAAETSTYCDVDDECLVKAKLLDDGTVPTYKEVETSNGTEGLLVGVPTDAVLGDELFQAKDGYSLKYFDVNENEITDPSAHIGTTDVVAVYNGSSMETQYSLVTYGDADGDGVFDVIDATLAHLCVTGFMSSEDSASIYEALKVRDGADDEFVVADDYTQIVNDCIKDKAKLKENLKGRKYFLDDTITYDTVFFTCDGKAKIPEYTADSNLKKIVTLSYNGSPTAPSEPGIYTVSAIIAENDKYIVAPGTRELGFMVIAPKDSTGNYNIAVDNSAKTITVNIENAYTSNAALVADFEKWLNGDYTLTVGGSNNPSTIASKLPNRSFTVYANQNTSLTSSTSNSVLGSLLPADDTLWKNSDAQNSVKFSVSKNELSVAFNVIFKQDANTIKNAIYKMRNTIAEAGRGQRTDVPTKNCASNYVKFENGYPCISIAVNDGSADFTSGLSSTGLKTMLLGYVDAISMKNASSVNGLSSASTTSLFDSSSNNKRYSTYTSSDLSSFSNKLKFASLVNKVTGISLTKLTGSMNSVIGTTGYCDYLCVESTKGLRYDDVFYMEYINFDSTKHSHYTISTNATNGTVSIDSKYPARFSLNEFFYVTTKANSGYELDTVTVVNSSTGTVIVPDDTGRYIMPAANVTVTATFKPVS